MKFGLKEIRLHFGLLDYDAIFVFGPFKNLQKYLRWKYEDKALKVTCENGTPLGRTNYKNGYVPVVWMPRLPKTSLEIATLAHESSHVMDDIIKWLEVYESEATNEIRGHGIGFMVKNILRRCKNGKA